ncbi:DUF6541 family protein [Amycolatopsis sp. CA-230715]|uniref:DUF6541 family protein n=1 Tax=Amycolatopsis sp. CA-230715 TaxID=2745196 RepID=UPI001C339DAE|nr:DUF6541 family protein [Amycolatopsis sp. CA-230715]QWF80212.1 hypothetical protein HUW46_03631 [Amycolatopsis sp. CA-230715]
MPSAPGTTAQIFTVALYLAVLFAPGAVAGFAAGLRGWSLVGFAPLLGYAIAGLAGPWYAAVGIPFTVVSFLAAVVLVTGIAYGARRFASRKDSPPREEPLWGGWGHAGVVVCLLAGAVIGAYTVLRGMGTINAIPQGFDGVYHGNGIRYIADTGDGGLTGTSSTNWYAPGESLFYPNAYHLVGSIAYRLSGADIPSILDTHAMLLPGLLALSMVVLVRYFRGRAVLAGATALVCVAPVTLFYESLDHGPLLPFLLGLALTPLGAVALHRYLVRPAADTGFVLVGAAVGLLTIHSSTLFAGVLFGLPLFAQHWAGRRLREAGRDLLVLLPIAVVCVLVAWLQLFGALGLATGDVPYLGWPATTKWNTAVGTLLTFQHFEAEPQFVLSVALLIGCVFAVRLGRLRWVAGTAVLIGVFAVAVMSTNAPFVMALSRPWWDDPYRFIAMATVPLCLLAAHGIAEVQRLVRDGLRAIRPLTGARGAVPAAVVVFAAFVAGTGVLYTATDAGVVMPGFATNTTRPVRDLPVSRAEAAAMVELGKLAEPGDWAMNDRADGSVWTYALSGVRTVAGHFDRAVQPPDARLLAARFNRYETDPEVRDAVRRLNVRWVILGSGGYPAHAPRPAGLTDLDRLPFLHEVYRNEVSVIYRLTR